MQTQVKPFTWLILAILSFSSFSLTAQSTPASAMDAVDISSDESATLDIPIASVEFDQHSYDFGTVDEGDRVAHTYTFTNTSDQPLVLSGAKGSCGCTVPQWPREAIMPGETASLTVEFNSKNKKGKRNQKVTITANTDPPQTFLYLTGEVNPNNDDTDGDYSEVIIEETNEDTDSDCFAIFPNPTSEVLQINMKKRNMGKFVTIRIYSKTGQLMAERQIESIEGMIEFSVSHYPADTYIANIQVEGRKPESLCFVVID